MKYWFSILLVAGIQTVGAQSILQNKNEKELSVLLNEIVVTGTGTEHYLKDAPVQTEVITGRALDQYQGRSLQDVLEGLNASISINPSDMGSGIQLNGLGNDYILILVNGKRMNGNIGGQNDLNSINLANIERIEIVKGAASSLYGSDAIAGVINIITRKNRDKFSITNHSRTGSYGDVLQSDVIGFRHGNLNTTTSASVNHTDGWRNTTEEWDKHEIQQGTVTKTVNRSTHFTLSEQLSYKVNSKLSLTGDASFYQRWNYRLMGPVKYTNTYNQFYRNFDCGVGGKYRLSELNYLTADISYGCYNYYYDYNYRETTDYFDEETGLRIIRYPGERILQTSQKRFLGQTKGIFHLTGNHILHAGMEFQYDQLRSPHRIIGNEASVYTLSAYAQEEWSPVESFNMTAGLRLVGHEEFGVRLTPKVSVLYKAGNFNFRGTCSFGFKAPTLKELYDDYIATIGGGPLKHYKGNTDLHPQKSIYYSTGIEYHGGKFQVSITGYYNHIADMIALNEVGTSAEDKLDEIQATMQYKNLSKARSFGGDVSVTYRVLPSFTIGGGYSYTDAKAQYTDDPKDANYMLYTPINGTSYHRANWKLAWWHDGKKYKLNVSLFGRYHSTRYYITDGNGKGCQLWRLNTQHELLKKARWNVQANVGVDNLFDYVDRTPFGRHRGTPSPGRTWYASVIIKFQNSTE